MKKRALSGSYNFASSYRFLRVVGAVFAAVVCLLGSAAGMAIADEEQSGSGDSSSFKDKSASSVIISDEELMGEMNEFLVRNASVIDYLSWKAVVDGYLTWKNEELAWKTSVDQYFSSQAGGYENLVWKTRVNEYLAWRTGVDTYLASRVSTGDYLTWKVNVEDYFAWKVSVDKYLPWKASDEEYLVWRTSVGTWTSSVDEYLKRKTRVKEHSFWQRRRNNWKESPNADYYKSKSPKADDYESESDPAPESTSSFLRGDVNQDGKLSVHDAKLLLDLLHNIAYEPSCLESADVNNDGKVRLGDAVQLLNYVVHGMAPPANPFPSCGLDPDEEGSRNDLGCGSYVACKVEKKEEEKSYTWTEISKAFEEQEEASEEDEAEEDDQ